MNNITEIELSKLVHHPQNPRKDLGDLTELTDSIKASGIMQNLTVVPEDDHYLVVIGNRRMEAAKLAGLDTAPCAVVNMTPAEQLSTMMVENMQRSDLTIFEQAAGFQLMMDMGDTVDSIAEKTGFSASTVRRRVKLMELDQKKLKEVSRDRQISMTDLDELNKISDINARNRLVSVLGTAGFKYELIKAKENEENERRLDSLVALMKKKKIPRYIKGDGSKTYSGAFFSRTDDPVDLEKEFENRFGEFTGLRYDTNIHGSCIYIYRDHTESEKHSSEAEEENRKRADYRRNIIRRVNHDMWLARLTFIRNYKEQDAREHFNDIARVIAERTAQSDYHNRDRIDIRLIMQIADDADDETVNYKMAMTAASSPARLMLWTAYDLMDDIFDTDGYVSGLWDGNPRHSTSNEERLNRICAFLIALGYEMSEEEEDIRDGYSDYFNVNSSVYQTEESRKPIPIDAIAKNDVRVFNALRRAGITDSDKLLEAAENGSLFKLFKIAGSKYGWLRAKALALGIVLPYKPGDDGADEPSGDDDEEE